MTVHSAAWLIPTMVKIQELSQSYSSMTEEKWTTWQREWAVMAVNYVQSHWSYWLISQNLRTVGRLQRTWLGHLTVSLSPAEPRLCKFWMCGSLNSACTWLIDEICRQAFLATAVWNEINLQTKCVQASFSSICVCYQYLVRCLILVHLPLIEWKHLHIWECAAWHYRSATKGVGSHGSELCSYWLMAGAASSEPKSRRASTL